MRRRRHQHPLRTRTRAGLVITAAAALLAAGCTDPPDDPTGEDTAPLNVYLYQKPKILSPLAPFNGPDRQVMMMIFDGLVNVDDQNEYVPRLAESWDISEDGSTYEFHLREGLSWSDGEPFTSEDVLFTYTMMANPQVTAQAGRFADVAGAQEVADGETDEVSGYSTPDEHTFVIEFAEPDVAFLSKIVGNAVPYIMPEHILGDVPADQLMNHEFFMEPTVGLGPYQLVEFLPDQHIELIANPHYREDVAIERIFLRHLDSDVATAQLETGEIDIASISSTDVDRVESLPGVSVVSTPGTGPTVVGIANDKPYLEDERVRQAMLYAIDRQGIVDTVLGGYASVPNVHWLTDWGVPDDLNEYPYDPARAEALLAEADWDPDQEITLQWPPGTRDRDSAAVIIQQNLEEVGFNVQTRQMQPAEFGESLDNREWDLAIWGGGVYTIDPSSATPVFTCDAFRPKGSNTPHYCNPDYDDLARQAQATTDQTERAQLYEQAARIVNEDVPFLWLYVPDTLYAVNDRLAGFTPSGTLENAFWNADQWSID